MKHFVSKHKEGAVLVILMIGLGAALAFYSGETAPFKASNLPSAGPETLKTFQGYSELRAFVDQNAQSAQEYSARSGLSFFGPPVELGAIATPAMEFGASSIASSSPASQLSEGFTGTNVQVQGVDEPDIVKTDGTHLFVSTSSTVSIIEAYPPSSTSIVSSISLQGGSILGIEVSENRLMVINQRISNTTYTDFLLYNISDVSSPSLLGNTSIAGNYVAARLSEGYFYAIVQQPLYEFDSSGKAISSLPTILEDGRASVLLPSSVYYTPNGDQIVYYTIVLSVSMKNWEPSAVCVLSGPSSNVYVSSQNIYVVYSDYRIFYADGIPGDVFTGGVISPALVPFESENSTIFRASYSSGSVKVEAVGSVPGTVLNQFSMDEYNGYFRVATSRFVNLGSSGTQSDDDVYVLGENMSQISALQNIAPGENIYAVRFVGEMGYVVTSEQIDPLFAISFKDVSHPVILSALKTTGFSDYLQPLWGGGYLIGVGKDAMPSSEGNFAWYLGLKVSLYRIFGNGSSSEVARLLIGDRGTDSPVLSDHLAFTFDPQNNLTVIPVLLAKVSPSETSNSGGTGYDSVSPPPYGNYVWQGVYVIRVSQSGFSVLGNVSQYPSSGNYGDSPVENLDISRSVIIGGYLYTISAGEVMVSVLSNFSTIARVTLPPN